MNDLNHYHYIFVTCHMKTQFDQFMRENRLDHKRFFFLYDPEMLRGVGDFSIIRLDGWYHNPTRFICEVNGIEKHMLERRKKALL